ncbi:MAG: hypothetical protein DRP96_08455, partial [Candidatus Neomarinimicrobiota bacterium]
MKRKFILFVTLFLSVTYSYSETINLDLNTAKKIALENNPSIKLAREGVTKSAEQVAEARGNLLPSINAFSSLQHSWDMQENIMPNFLKDIFVQMNMPGANDLPDYLKMSFGLENTVISGLQLQQPVFTGGTIWNGYQISKLGYNIAKSQLRTTEQQILSDVTSSYYRVLFMKSTLSVSEEALQSAEENLNQVTKYFDVGKSSRF